MWPTDFVRGDPLPEPGGWGRPGIVMFFNLECPGCISRGIPLLKRLVAEHHGELAVLLIHTSYGHRFYPREQVVPQLQHFADSFARLDHPIALDLDGELARHYGVEGTPHWLVFAADGEQLRSIYGSQDNARTRLEYLLAELPEVT